jgi:hypothetical protein
MWGTHVVNDKETARHGLGALMKSVLQRDGPNPVRGRSAPVITTVAVCRRARPCHRGLDFPLRGAEPIRLI